MKDINQTNSMKQRYKLVGIIGIIGLLLSPNIIAIAQETNGLDTSRVASGALGDCFDTYRFGSLEMNLTPNKSEYEPGDGVVMKGKITNTNNYPLIGVSVSARVLKDIPNANNQAFTTTIDEFVLVNNITLDAQESINIEEVYNLSMQAIQGEYQIYLFGYQEDRFNISGLSFTDDIYGSRFSFSVKGGNTESVYLDQTRTTVGGKKHVNHAYVTQHNPSKPIEVKIPLKNTTNKEQKVTLDSNLYRWDGLREEQIERFNSREVTIPAKGEIEIVETVQSPYLPVYYLKLVANVAGVPEAQKQQSISNIRFIAEGLNAVRFNWVGFNTFAKGAGQEGKVVTCIHNTSTGTANDISVETKVTDKRGREIASSSYRGNVGGAISGIEANLPTDKIINEALITSVLKDKDGKIIDTVNIAYDCKKIGDGSKCIKEPLGTVILQNSIGILVILGIIILVTYSVLLQKKSIHRMMNKQ